MSRNKMSGFTLIELMVVIVIIGVLASLAIPRFTEASIKAKAAEAPRVIASWESAVLSAIAEGVTPAANDLVFKLPGANGSKWFTYTMTDATAVDGTAAALTAAATSLTGLTNLTSTYGTDDFTHACTGDKAPKLLPNFCTATTP